MKKTTTKKSPTGAPLDNPLKFFREGGEKRKAMFKNGGYNVPKNTLPRKDNGGPGSGMGRMAADDAAFDAMINESSAPVSTPQASRPIPSRPYGPMNGRMNIDNPMRSPGSGPSDSLSIKGNYGPPPGMGKTTMKSSGVPDTFKVGPYGNTTSGQIYIPEEKNGGIMKKGGATKAKKFARKKK